MSVPETVPARVDGLTTIAGMWFDADPSSSSQVRKTTVPPAAYARDARIFANHDWSHASPVATEQSCVSLHRFGVTNENDGSVSFVRSPRKFPLAVVPIGTSQTAQSVRMPV